MFKAKSWRRGTVKETSVRLCLGFALLLGEDILSMFIGKRKEIGEKEELQYIGANTLICENLIFNIG